MQGRVAPEVKSRLYENTEVRYNNPTLRTPMFLVSLSRSRETLQDVRKGQVTVSSMDIDAGLELMINMNFIITSVIMDIVI